MPLREVSLHIPELWVSEQRRSPKGEETGGAAEAKPERSARVRAHRLRPKGARDGRSMEAAGIEPASVAAPAERLQA